MAKALEIAGGATLSAQEVARVEEALAALAKDHHAPREISLTATLHIHHEYPKHIVVGKDENGEPIVEVVHSADEEAALQPKSGE